MKIIYKFPHLACRLSGQEKNEIHCKTGSQNILFISKKSMKIFFRKVF